MNILDYYECAKLSAAAYTVLDGKALADIAELADGQERVPLAVANQTFLSGSREELKGSASHGTTLSGNPLLLLEKRRG